LLGRDGNCEDTSKWVDAGSTHELDPVNKTTGTYGMKGIITTSSAVVHRQNTNVQAGKYYVALADLKNGNAAEVHLDYNTVSSTLVTDSTKFTTVYIKLNPLSDYNGNLHFIANGTAGQYGYFDAVRLYEISAAEYGQLASMTLEQIAAKYPYVDNVKHVNSPYMIKYGENLLPSFNEWTLHANAAFPTNQGLNYILYRKDGTVAASGFGITTGLSSVTINATADSTNLYLYATSSGAGTYTFTNPMLNIGTTALPFKPRNDDHLYFPNTKLASNVNGTVYDEIVEMNGKYFKHGRFRDLVLDGSLTWVHTDNFTGYKRFALNVGTNNVKPSTQIVVKYDGKILGAIGSVDGVVLNADGNVFIDISNDDSGFGQDYNPSIDELKAYFYGWKMCDNANATLPYTSGTKTWAYRNDVGGFAGVTITLPTTFANTYEGKVWQPYKLTYQLATPTIEEIPHVGSITLHEGANQIEVGNGVVVREKVTPYTNAIVAQLHGNISGTGNTNATLAQYGGKIARNSTQPAGLHSAVLGGVNTFDVGVLNPWGDNTHTQRSHFRATAPIATSLTSGVKTKVLFGSKSADYLSEFDTTLGRFTARADGIYHFTASVHITAAINTVTEISLYMDGGMVRSVQFNQTPTDSTLVINVPLGLLAGQYVDVYALQNTGSAKNTDARSSYTYFVGTRIA
jgi:hypothetical protein